MTDSATEARHPVSAGLHLLPGAKVLDHLLRAQEVALHRVADVLPALEAVAERAAAALRAGGKLGYAGAGSAGLMALSDCLELAGTFGIPPHRTPMLFAGGAATLLHMTGGVEDDPTLANADFAASGLRAGDLMVCVSASGTTPYTVEVARLARAAGVGVAGMANVPDAPLLRLSDLPVLLDTGPEVVSGSTRMGAATAQKAALNMISVLMGIRLGHVVDGYMVNVVADNAKLRDRAARIVAALSGAGPEESFAALEAAGGAVKPAVLVAQGRTLADATQILADSAGHLASHLDGYRRNRAKTSDQQGD